MKKKLLFAFSLASAVSSYTNTYACTCAPMERYAAESYANSYSIFIGVAGQSVQLDREDFSGRGMIETTFQVTKAIKGTHSEQVKVATSRSGASCGISFRRGETFLVMTHKDESGLVTTSLCSAGPTRDPMIAATLFELGKASAQN